MGLRRAIVVAGLILATPAIVAAAEQVILELRDGSRLVGEIVDEDATRVRLRTGGGLEMDVPVAQIVTRRRAGEKRARLDPNYSRLMFAPTGRPLRKGDGYFSDYELLFPGASWGATGNVTLSGGVSVIPGLGLDNQLFYFSPKVGFEVGEKQAYSAGVLYATASEDGGDRFSLGIAYGVGTWGDRRGSVTLGFGYAADLEDGGDGMPILLVGGHKAVSSSIAFVGESWLLLRDVDLRQQPVGLAVRFFGDRLSADVGVIFSGELLDQGLPLPWLSVSYHFGPRRARTEGAVRGEPMIGRP